MRIDGCHIDHDCDAVCSTGDTKTMVGTSNQPVCVLSPVLKEMWLIYYTALTEKIVGNILPVVRHLSPAPSREKLENKELN